MSSNLPRVDVTIQDGALGLSAADASETPALVGISSLGTPCTLYTFGDIKTLKATLGYGPLVEAAAQVLATAGGPVYCVPVTAAAATGVGPTTKTGAGAGTLVVSGTPNGLYPAPKLQVKITTNGGVGTGKFKCSVDGGLSWSVAEITITADTGINAWADTGLTLTFAGTQADTDSWTFGAYKSAVCSAVVKSVSPAATATMTVAGTPKDSYEAIVTCVTAGALGTSTFKVSLDGGLTETDPILSTLAGTYVIPNTGLTITITGSMVAGESHSFTAAEPSYSTTTMGLAVAALMADPRTWGYLHLVGEQPTEALAETMAAALKVKLDAAEVVYRYVFGVVEGSKLCADATLVAAFVALESNRIMVAGGDCRIISQLTGQQDRRSAAWPMVARLAKTPIHEHLGRVASGSLPGVTALYHDEQITETLDAQRFATLRTIIGMPGFYITAGKLMAAATSDFQRVEYRRVIDRACAVARVAMLRYLNESLRTNANGTIYENDALMIEADVKSQLDDALVNERHASAVQVAVDRTVNLTSTGELSLQVRVRPLGYAQFITITIGFQSTAFAAA